MSIRGDTSVFKSERQSRIFEEILTQLEILGYRPGDLLVRSYPVVDWFAEGNPPRTTPAAAFWTVPQSYDSACFGVLVSNGRSGPDLVADFRALGAPLAFEVREDAVVQWGVGKDSRRSHERLTMTPESIGRVFQDHAREWAPREMLRVKNIGLHQGFGQHDMFVDTGLIPALESQIRQKLTPLLSTVIHEARIRYHARHGRPADGQKLFRLVFRFLAAKVLHDRHIARFPSFTARDSADILVEIARYYGDATGPVLTDAATRDAVCRALWIEADLRNLSVETLASIYESTLIAPALREEYGAYSTPHNIARYIVHRLPLELLTQDAPLIVDPFAGHGVFLVAALRRLREDPILLNMRPKERHRYFVSRLQGFDINPFAAEVARLCLILADFPNPNGWKVSAEDTFSSPRVLATLKKTGAVLSNPPFGKFPEDERHSARDVYKPARFLDLVLDALPSMGMLGMVLPRQIIDGVGYRETRRVLARRFADIEVVGLPDKVFTSSVESALLIAKNPRVGPDGIVAVTYTEVADQDRERFLTEYAFTRRDRQIKTEAEAAVNIAVAALADVWNALEGYETLGDVAKLSRGLEWEGPIGNFVSDTERRGFERGIQTTGRRFYAFQPPRIKYLCVDRKHRRLRAPGAFDLPWKSPKVIVNAARVSRGWWRIAALPDASGLVCTQRFHTIWPEVPEWNVAILAAVLNGPVANAFVAAHEGIRDVTADTLRGVPLPRLDPRDVAAIQELVAQYMSLAKQNGRRTSQPELAFANSTVEPRVAGVVEGLVECLLKIDALVLKGYGLSPRLERSVLDKFRNARRPVPFNFPPYFPEGFESTVPLWMYVSPEYRGATPTRFLSEIPSVEATDLMEALLEVE